MEISEEDLRRLIAGAYKAGVIGVVGLMEYSRYDYDHIGQDFAREQVRRWIAEAHVEPTEGE